MNTFPRAVRHFAIPVHKVLRQHKIRLFFDSLKPSPSDAVLDVGGWTGIAGELSPIYEFFDSVASINLVNSDHGNAMFFLADACQMPFASGSFDFVFSNAVIEHVGPLEKQQQMADEIRRVVRKGYFVATPNRWFPIDPHSYLPYFHLLPIRIRRAINHGYDYWMLSAGKMKHLFPEASIIITPERTSIIALYPPLQ